MTDTLTPIHERLDDFLVLILDDIDMLALFAAENLDRLVRDGDRRQQQRYLEWLHENRPDLYWREKFKILHSGGYRSYEEQVRLYRHYHDRKSSLVAAPQTSDYHGRHEPTVAFDPAEPGSVYLYRQGVLEPWHGVYRPTLWQRFKDFFRSVA